MGSPIVTIKELVQTHQALLLAAFTFSDGTVLRVTTQDLTGAFQYGGNDYFPRVISYTIPRKQLFSETGADIVPTMSLRLADADEFIWTNYGRLKGFKGASLAVDFLFREAGTANFSSDAQRVFTGIVSPAQFDNAEVSVTASSRLNLGLYQLPSIRVQKLCPWVFPTNATERQAGADDAASPFYFCGYSPDASGGNARGNYESGSTPFAQCEYTKEACQSRGMYETDSAARVTGRFGGIVYAPPQSAMVRGYRTKWEEVFNNSNEAKYNDVIPMGWGEGWIEPMLLNAITSGNDTSMEWLICAGEIDYIHEVVANDVRIPHTFNDNEMSNVPPGVTTTQQALVGGFWGMVNRGDRDGRRGRDGNGDPYGNLAVINIVVPRKLADAGSIPRVRILAKFAKVRVYSDGSTFTLAHSTNPAWIMLDLLARWGPFSYADIDINTFVSAAAKYAATINRTDQFGNTTAVQRFRANLVLRQRRSAAEIIRGLLNASKSYLTETPAGKIGLYLKETLAEQQPGAITGSNFTGAITSKNYAGAAADGYVAYEFGESNILDEGEGDPVKLETVTPQPNRVNVVFQNGDNRWNDDELTVVDAEDVGRLQKDETGSVPMEGVPTFDQGRRAVATILAEALRGNPAGSTAGTIIVELATTFKAVHLRLGQIVRVNWPKKSLSNQLVRVVGIEPYSNWEKVRLTLKWHNDNWYVDTFGQFAAPRWSPGHRNKLERPSFAWCPGDEAPLVGDPYYSPTDMSFRVKQEYETAADDGAVAKVTIRGVQIVNDFRETPVPPFVPLQGTAATTGGTIAGNLRMFLALVAVDASGYCSPLSELCWIDIPAGTNTNTATIPSIVWPSGTSTWRCYGGGDSSRPTLLNAGSGTPSSVTVTATKIADQPAPDQEFDRYRLMVKRVLHGGIIGAQVAAVTPTTIQLATPGNLTVNQLAAYEVSSLAKIAEGEWIPLYNADIDSNSADTLTLAGGAPSASASLAVGDVVVIRSKPTVGSDGTGNYVEDANWVNVFSPSGLTASALRGFVLRFIAGTGRGTLARIKDNTSTRIYVEGDWWVTPDSTSRYIVEEPNWQVTLDTAPMANSNPNALLTLSVDVSNYARQTILMQVRTVDGGDQESYEGISPIREVYLFGRGDQIREISADTAQVLGDQVLIGNTSGGNRTITGMAPGLLKGRYLKIKKGPEANTNKLIFDPPGTVDGSATLELTQPNESAIVLAGATEYKVIARGVASAGAPAGGSSLYHEVSLGAVANNVLSPASPAAGTVLTVKLINSVADPAIPITWDAAYVGGLATVNPGNGLVTVAIFVGDGTKWRLIGAQTGQA